LTKSQKIGQLKDGKVIKIGKSMLQTQTISHQIVTVLSLLNRIIAFVVYFFDLTLKSSRFGTHFIYSIIFPAFY
jgi:hypothetical protein